MANITIKDCVYLANDIIVDRNLLIPRLTTFQQLNAKFFAHIFDEIFNVDCNDWKIKSKDDEIKLMENLLNILSNEIIGVSLDHIKANDIIIDRNIKTIYNLLEIIASFIKYIPKQFESNEISDIYHQTYASKAIQTNNNNNNNKINDETFLKVSSGDIPVTNVVETTYPSLASNCSHNAERSNEIVVEKYETNPKSNYSQMQNIETKLISGASNTSPKVTFEQLKSIQADNFAYELGYRLQCALKLRDMTKVIEDKIKRSYGDVTVSTHKYVQTRRKPLNFQNRTVKADKKVSLRKTFDKTSKQTKSGSNFDEFINQFSEIPRNTIRLLKAREINQQKLIDSIKKDVVINESKVKSQLNAAIDRQNKRTHIIRDDIRHVQTLAQSRNSKLEIIKQNSLKREARSERVRIVNAIDSLHNDMLSKFKKAKSIEENMVRKDYEKRFDEQQQQINDFRLKMRERYKSEQNKQKQLLTAFENLYQNKFDMINENLNKEEYKLRHQLRQQTQLIRNAKKQHKIQFERDFRNLFIKNSNSLLEFQ